jgi:predicted nucleic acid-binding protein
LKNIRLFVADASAILGWYLNEPLQKEALKFRSDFLTGKIDLLVPSFAFIELMNRLERLDWFETKELFELFGLLVHRATSDEDLVQTFQLVRKRRRNGDKHFTVYDALYVQLAILEKATLLSADEGQLRAASALGCVTMRLQDYP